jgi:hypothetical protein
VQLVVDTTNAAGGHLHLETAEGVDERDRRELVEIVRDLGCRDAVTYRHLHASHEPILAAPDAIGWAWTKGGEWRDRARPLVTSLITPDPGHASTRAPQPSGGVSGLRLPRGSAPRAQPVWHEDRRDDNGVLGSGRSARLVGREVDPSRRGRHAHVTTSARDDDLTAPGGARQNKTVA